jgi:hypothetical protein
MLEAHDGAACCQCADEERRIIDFACKVEGLFGFAQGIGDLDPRVQHGRIGERLRTQRSRHVGPSMIKTGYGGVQPRRSLQDSATHQPQRLQ